MRELFKKLIRDSQEREFSAIIPRDYNIPVNSSKIISLIGIRRCGKTYLLYHLIQQLRVQVDPRNIVYINFEDDRLFPINIGDMDALTEAYYELYPDKRSEKVYFFFDEIQNIENWEKYVRRIYDTLTIQIFITGSSSKLLSKEIATSLRGRTIVYEIFPFSFKEYLNVRQIDPELYSTSNISHIKNALGTYLMDGGFPEIFGIDQDIQRRILKDYLDLIIYKDLVERYSIKNQALLKHLLKYLFTNIGSLISFNKLYNNYKSLGYKASKDTLYDYISYLQDAYAVFTPSIFRNSVREKQRNPRKIYSIDNGFRKLFTVSLSGDYSKLYENVAFLHLRRYTDQIYYFKQTFEVDLYCRLERELLINVSYQIDNPATLQRELRGLVQGLQYFKLKEAYLITADKDEIIKTSNGFVHVLPMWKWLLQDL